MICRDVHNFTSHFLERDPCSTGINSIAHAHVLGLCEQSIRFVKQIILQANCIFPLILPNERKDFIITPTCI